MEHKIDSIEIKHYRLPLSPPFHASWDPNPRRSFTSTLVRVTSGEFEGVGSGDTMLGFQGHENLFVGHDVFSIKRHVKIIDNLQFHYGRMWPLEIAFWDLMAKIVGKPLWKFLGGEAARVPLYASTGERVSRFERAARIRKLRDAGFSTFKIRFHAADPKEDIKGIQALREAFGDEIGLLVDANQGWKMPWDASSGWDYKTACWVADALDEVDVYWLEEPLHRHDYEGLARLRKRSRLRIAGGEGNREFADFQNYLAHDSLDVYQPDVAWSTGIDRGCQLAMQVQASDGIYSPHTWGDGLVLLSNLHVCAAVSNAPFIEYPFDPPSWVPEKRDFILPSPLLPDPDGSILLSNKPGLGVEIDWDGIADYQIDTGQMASF